MFELEVQKESTSTIEIPVEEFTRLKDIETRFTIIREQMLKAEYCPIHTQIILGIENDFKEKKCYIDEKGKISMING